MADSTMVEALTQLNRSSAEWEMSEIGVGDVIPRRWGERVASHSG